MSIFSIRSKQTAPEAPRPILEGAKAKTGFVPDLLGGMAASPPAVEAYAALSRPAPGRQERRPEAGPDRALAKELRR